MVGGDDEREEVRQPCALRSRANWTPVSMYTLQLKMMGNGVPGIVMLQAWRQELMKPVAMMQKVEGHLHLGERAGLLEEVVAGSSSEVAVSTER